MNHLIISGILFFVPAVTYGQNAQNNEQAICNKYNIREIQWTCKRTVDCEWSKNILNTPNEHNCSSTRNVKKICCPQRTNVASPPIKKNFTRIALKKCNEYAKARFVEKCSSGILIDDVPECHDEMDCSKKTEPLIIGGVDTEEKEFPHMALIGGGNGVNDINWFCGGSLISESFILSAAHCTNKGTSREVKWAALGLMDRSHITADKLNKNIFKVVKTHNHPKYNAPKTNYDIALYQLKDPIKFSPFMRPICLHTEYNIPAEATKFALISGWGVTEVGFDVADVLQKANVSILGNDACVKEYATDSLLDKGFEGKNMLCAGDYKFRKDTCSGDSGGPIKYLREKCLYVQIGITSFGSASCGNGKPAIYTRISSYLDWIVNIVWPNEI